MKLSDLSKNWSIAKFNNTWLLFGNVTQSVAILVLVGELLSSHERIVLVPPQLDNRAVIGWNSANEYYYRGWGLYVANMLGNLTPKNLQFTIDTLSPMFDVRIYAPIRAKLLSLMDDVNFNKGNSFSYFTPNPQGGVFYEKEINRVFIVGTLTTANYTGNTPAGQDIINVVYELDFQMRNGLPIITHFDSYEGSQIHSQAFLHQHPNWKEEAKAAAEARAKKKEGS